MDVLDSVRRAVRHYPGGLEAVATRLGKSWRTLEKELLGAAQFKLGAVDAADIAAMCAAAGAQHALEYPTRLAEHVGATLLPVPHGVCADTVTAEALAALMREFADVVTAVAKADADGKIKDYELRKVQEQWAELVGSGLTLLQGLQARRDAHLAQRRALEAAR